ncbi:MAG: ABC transporter ATP-binding protein/permease [Eubacterium sp.]|nr:ABC transporter ATP-binding protein/permease [Eubacterium sp.]
MFKLLKYLKQHKVDSILAPILKMIEAVFDLLVPIVVALLIDNGIRKSNTPYIWKMGALLFVLAIIGLTIALIAQYMAARAAGGFGTKLRHDVFRKVALLSDRDLDRIGGSSLITRLTSDINMIQAQLNMSIRLIMRSPVIVIGAVVCAFTINAKLALIFVISVPILALLVVGIMVVTIPLYNKVQQKLDRVMITTRENLTGVRVIRAFNKQQSEIENYKDQNNTLNRYQVFAGKIATIMNPGTYLIINLAIIAILIMGGKQVDSGFLTQGQIVALVNYMLQILVELVKLAALIINLTKAFASAKRVNEVLDYDVEANDGIETVGMNEMIVFDKVSMAYPGASENVLTDISFVASKGKKIGIIGATGSGKSTLVNLLPRFYKVSGGTIKLGDKNINEYELKNLRSMFGITPQDVQLFRGTIRSNLKFGNEKATEQEMENALKLACAYDFVMEKGGLDSEVMDNGSNFSGGQRQRLTIARALVRNPKILILDDSSSALDYDTDALLKTNLKSLTNTTMFVISQRTNSIMDLDEIIVLDEGRIVGKGNHKDLLETCEVYKEIHESQYKQNIYTNKLGGAYE